MVLAVGREYDFSKMLKTPVIMAVVLLLLIALQSLPVWVFDAGVAWHSGLAAVSSGIIMRYRGALAGLFAIALSICLYFSTLLLNQTNGHLLLLLLAAVVAACDCAAYFVGRSVGGVSWPSVSPNKTVSGSVMESCRNCGHGGPFWNTGFGNDYRIGLSLAWMQPSVFLGCGIAVLSQIGDLLESALKRRLNVKDSSSILPGHGGLLDRFDGYLFTVPGFYLFFFVI